MEMDFEAIEMRFREKGGSLQFLNGYSYLKLPVVLKRFLLVLLSVEIT